MDALELINLICPEHCRTSCSDSNTYNGLYSDTHHTRCVRCTLLEIMEGGILPESHTFSGSFSIDDKKEDGK